MHLFTASKANLFAGPMTPAASGNSETAVAAVATTSSGRTLAAAASSSATQYSCEYGSTKYYLLCGLGGILSCGITHTAVTPLDLVKCRLQVSKSSKPSTSLLAY